MPEITFDPKTGKAVFNKIDRNDPAEEAAFWKAHGGSVVNITARRPPPAASLAPDAPKGGRRSGK